MNQQLRGALFVLLFGTAILASGGSLLYSESQETTRARPIERD